MPALPQVRYPGNVDGILYEPRAFWDVARVRTNVNPSARVVLNRQNFLNGEPFPVTLTKLLMAPVNFKWREHVQAAAPTTVTTYRADGASSLLTARVQLSVPQRQHYSRRVLVTAGYTARPTWEPQIRNSTGAGGLNLQFASSLWNTCRWQFRRPMILPKLGTVEFDLASIVTLDAALDATPPAFSIVFDEGPPPGTPAPGRLLLPGNGRLRPRTTLVVRSQSALPPLFGADPFGDGGGTPGSAWDAQNRFSAEQFDQQNANASGSGPLQGFAVHFDQIDFDATLNANDVDAGANNNPISPIALRIPCRARTRNGGTGHWWWRPGAPLALVCPTITPAQVYKLPVPITLQPGDSIEVELQTPLASTVDGNLINKTYQLGLSLTGYAAIEG